MNLLAGKTIAVLFFILAEREKVNITKHHTSFLLLILRKLDSKLIHEISEQDSFEVILKKWGEEVKQIIDKKSEDIIIEDFLRLINNCSLSEDNTNNVVLLIYSIVKDENIESVILKAFHLDNKKIATIIYLGHAFVGPESEVNIQYTEVSQLLASVYHLVDKIRKSVFLYQKSIGIDKDDYNILTEYSFKALILNDDFKEFFPEYKINFSEKAYENSIEDGGLVLLSVLHELRDKITKEQREQLFGSIIRVIYSNRPPSEISDFDYILLGIISCALDVESYLESKKNNLQDFSNTYVITPNLTYKGKYLNSDTTEKEAMTNLLLDISKKKYDISFFKPLELIVKKSYVPVLFVDCDINLRWYCEVESHREEGETTKVIGALEHKTELPVR